MSDTDDTDLLLLIPPDFFSIQSSDSADSVKDGFNSSRLATLVGDLSSRMDALENHILTIEDNDDLHTRLNSLECICEAQKDNKIDTDELKKYDALPALFSDLGVEEVNNESLEGMLPFRQSVCKAKTNGCNGNTPQAIKDNVETTDPGMSNAEFSQNDYTNTNVEQIRVDSKNELSEINTLKFDEIERFFQNCNKVQRFRKLNVNDINSCNQIKNNFNLEDNRANNSSHSNGKFVDVEDTSVNNYNSLQNKRTLKRNNIYDGNNEHTASFDHNYSLPPRCKKIDYDEHSLVAFSSNTVPVEDCIRTPQTISLSKVFNDDSFLTVGEQLETERYKRQRCEKIIQDLESKLLELEQKLAVAVNVDNEKDELINVLTKAWTKLVCHWKQLEEQRHDVVLTLEKERTIFHESVSSANRKINELDSRLATAMQLLANYKENSDQMEMIKLDTMQRITSMQNKFEQQISDLKYDMTVLREQNNQLVDECRAYEVDISHKNQQLAEAGNVIRELEDRVKTASEKNDNMTEKQTADQDIIIMLTKNVRNLETMLENANNSEQRAKEELKQKEEEMCKFKNALKYHYQNQLECIVKEKVEELQRQLDKAETFVRTQQRRREQELNDELQNKIRQLEAFQKVELKQLKKKYDDHVERLKCEMKNKDKKIMSLEDDLKSISCNKLQLIRRLQKTVENQWLETLNVITSSEDNHDHKNFAHASKSAELKVGFNNSAVGVSDTANADRNTTSHMNCASSNAFINQYLKTAPSIRFRSIPPDRSKQLDCNVPTLTVPNHSEFTDNFDAMNFVNADETNDKDGLTEKEQNNDSWMK